MKLSTIFEKPIDRPIEGVIKADDEASLRLEVEEYVLTNEVEKRLEEFLYAYNNTLGANGVWISGFFGSGKSHLLKMLALLMENRMVEGAAALDLFAPKCGNNEILRADLRRAAGIASRSILFNIDQKADVISKSQVDALLAVFVKVFDEMCGYYGKQGHIAQFERDLDSRGQYHAFKDAFREIAGLDWEVGREQALLEAHHIVAAYAQATGAPASSAQGILDKYRAEYRLSIEDFAGQVYAYIQRQGPDFRLNFFVDEAGQYIADNVKLMTNLQTVAESLATKCRGRSWIVVTAQEDMDAVIGEIGQQQGNDFSKIQDRFKSRMKLTSADVAEVIRRRLLLKNAQGIEALSEVYARQQNSFRTLFDFADGSQSYRNFRDREDFVHSYPFIPYQYTLFQSAIQNLSLHSAFEGKHRSVGERSMLEVFQQVAVRIADRPLGQLATFDLMFEGIRSTLKSQIQRSVLNAEQHLDSPFAVRLLKALFLVKYVKEFKATPRNLTVLMLDGFDSDLAALRKRVEQALNLLEQQTYVQRNGEEYEYLTDEEKDVEQEIKNTEVETASVADELARIVFDHLIKDRKFRYEENGQDYAFARKLDDTPVGRQAELAIHVISPFHEHAENEAVLRSQSMGRDELLVILPASDRLMRDLLMVKRTDKYIRQNITIAQQESVRRILSDKQHQNAERLKALRALVEQLLSQATLIISGQELEIAAGEPVARIQRGFHELLVRTYPNLRMLRGITYTENDVAGCLRPESTLFGSDGALVSEAEQEMLAFVQANNRSGLRTTLQGLVNRFERKPYGWYLAAIQCTAAKLVARGKVEVRQDGALLEDQAIERALRNTHGFGSVVLEPQIDFTPSQVRHLRDFYAEFFDGPPAANEAKALGQETAHAFQSLQRNLEELQEQGIDYPFLAALAEPAARLRELASKPYAFYLTELRQVEDALFDLKESVIDPIRRFMGGSQRAIYGQAQRFLAEQEPNFAYVNGDAAAQLRSILRDPACYQGNRMAQAKALLDGLQAEVHSRLGQERAAALQAVAARWERTAGMAEFADLSPDQRAELRRPFAEMQRTIDRQTLVAVIRDTLRRFDDEDYNKLLGKMATWSKAARSVPEQAGGGIQPGGGKKVVEFVSQRSIYVAFGKASLDDETDVDNYLAALRKAMMEVIRDGKRVQIS